jgi:lysophospholipase L1-like esterase
MAGVSCSRTARTQKALEVRAEKIGAPPSVLRIPSTNEMSGQGPFRSAAWFTLNWQERRLYAWERRQFDKRAVVFVGDSIIRGWDGLEQAFPNFPTANRGISGDTTRGVLYRLDEDVLKLKPRAVVLLCGINDLGDGATSEQVIQNIQSLIRHCQNTDSNLPVVVCTVLPVGSDKEVINRLVRELNDKLKLLGEEKTNVFVADAWSALANTNGVAQSDDFPDLAHPNESGYTKLGKCLRPILEKIEHQRDVLVH